jgi:hypothetical protein
MQFMSRAAQPSATRPVSAISDFGPTAHPVFPLWWDMVAITAFSLAIYVWALRVALPVEKVQALIERDAARA